MYQISIQLSLRNKQWGEVVIQQKSVPNYNATVFAELSNEEKYLDNRVVDQICIQLSLENKQWGEVLRLVYQIIM